MFECNNDILFLNLVEHGVSEPVECVYSGLGRILDSCSYTPADPDLLLGVDWAHICQGRLFCRDEMD